MFWEEERFPYAVRDATADDGNVKKFEAEWLTDLDPLTLMLGTPLLDAILFHVLPSSRLSCLLRVFCSRVGSTSSVLDSLGDDGLKTPTQVDIAESL